MLALVFNFSASASVCELPTERQFVEAIFDHNFDHANTIINELDFDKALIPSIPFYQGLSNWIQGNIHSDKKQIKRSLHALSLAVDDLKIQHQVKDTTASFLGWNLAAANTARIFLVSNQMISAYNMGNPAIENLAQYLKGPTTQSGRAAATLALGLHHIYSNAVPDKYKWASFLVKPSGNFELGRKLIEQSIQESLQLAPEAARALLTEIPWSRGEVCDYQQFSKALAEKHAVNPDFSIAYQGILLRCGWPKYALTENQRFLSEYNGKTIVGLAATDYTALFQLARIRGFVELQDIQSIKQENPVNNNVQWLKQFALANVYDTTGDRTQSADYYNSIIDAPAAPIALRKSASMHLEQPYSMIQRRSANRIIRIANCMQINQSDSEL